MDKPDQNPQQPVDDDYKAKYEALYAACGKANAERKKQLVAVSRDIGALLKIICEPDPPGCSGKIPTDNLADLLVQVQQANATKQQKLQAIDKEIDLMMEKICEPDPPGCLGGN
ncbi:MAG TPA: hypothetical protein VKD91_19650 [Pyrinomonadaceae bacterium]|nr:hypothetical protein [Pyrinomonadaceae bacterium]